MIRFLTLMLAVLCGGAMVSSAAPAWAAGGKKDAAEEERNIRDVDLPTVVMPISVDGKLVNYLFVTFKVTVGPKADPWKVRDKAHISRDAMIRAVHRVPMTDPNNLKDFDRSKIKSLLMPELNRVYGPGTIVAMRVVQLDSIKQVVHAPKAAR